MEKLHLTLVSAFVIIAILAALQIVSGSHARFKLNVEGVAMQLNNIAEEH